MPKNTYNYAELYYLIDPLKSNEYRIVTIPVENRDPFSISYDHEMVGFRFFSVKQSFLSRGLGVVQKYDDRIDVSRMHYFGKDLSIEEMIRRHPCDMDRLKYIQKKGISTFIDCDNGFHVPAEHDFVTMKDLIIERKRNIEEMESKMMFSKHLVFSTLATIISEKEKRNFEFGVKIQLDCKDPSDNGSKNSNARKDYKRYIITDGKETPVDYCELYRAFPGNGLNEEVPTFEGVPSISFFKLRELLEPLFEQYPYLEEFLRILKASYKDDFSVIDITDVLKEMSVGKKRTGRSGRKYEKTNK